MIKKIWAWLVKSSADVNAMSLTLRGIIAGAITFLTMLANFQHLTVPNQFLTQWGDAVIIFVQSAFMLLATGMTLYGASRKLWTTFTGTNAVLNLPDDIVSNQNAG